MEKGGRPSYPLVGRRVPPPGKRKRKGVREFSVLDGFAKKKRGERKDLLRSRNALAAWKIEQSFRRTGKEGKGGRSASSHG